MIHIDDLPRACDASSLAADPFAHLRRAAEAPGPVVLLREGGAIFSRRPDCPLTVAAFGPEALRQALSNDLSYAMPPSAADLLGLPERLRRLNHGLHSMSGGRHRRQKLLIGGALAATERDFPQPAVNAAVDRTVAGRADAPLPMLAAMRTLLESVAATILFGPQEAQNGNLARTLGDYFRRRRAASSPLGKSGATDRDDLARSGAELDEALSRAVRASRSDPNGRGLVGTLATARDGDEIAFTDDELVAHANVLFMSATEPVAVALTWLFLLLSQAPWWFARLRSAGPEAAAARLAPVVAETLRLLTPNAIMVRSARPGAVLCGVPLPDHSEVVAAPLVAHRNPDVFPCPDRFDPRRWRSARPGPFEYLPFGAGLHVCVGQGLAKRLIRSVALRIVEQFDLVLASAEPIDWHIDIMLKPSSDILFVASPSSSSPLLSMQEWVGPSRDLVDLELLKIDLNYPIM